ncbi:MAG: hypothetical protein AAFV53_39670 [Myxococcota bacterium]
MRAPAVILLLSSGCSDGASDSGCPGDTPPAITALQCANSGVQRDPDSGADLPTFTLTAAASDPDGDLGQYTASVVFDDVLDGTLDNAVSLGEINGGVGGCDETAVTFQTTIVLRGGPPLYATTYEWGVAITDANGIQGAPGVVTCTTPDAQGQGGSR